MDRMACVWIRRFPLRHLLLGRPELEGRPLAVYREEAGRTRVLCASRQAERQGLVPGLALPDARALVPELSAEPGDPRGEAERLEALGELLLEFGPRVAVLPPDALVVEVGGSAGLFGGEGALLQRLAGRLEQAGFSARTALSDGAAAARVLAELGPRDGLVVPPGRQAQALAPLPVRALLRGLGPHHAPADSAGGSPEALGEAFARALELLGVLRVRDLAALPEGAVAERFGPPGRLLHRRARGLSEPPLDTLVPAEEVREVLELEGACADREPLLFHIKRLLDRATLRLEARGEAAARLRLELLHHPDGASEVEVTLGRPTRDPRVLHRVLRERLSATDGRGPITRLLLVVPEAERSEGVQRDLVLAAEQRGEDVPDLVERLQAALGEDAVFGVRLTDVYRPEAAWEAVPFPPPPPTEEPPSLPRPLVLFPEPELLEVARRGGRRVVRWRGRRLPVARRGPPERLSGEWWGEVGGFDREYRELVLGDGTRLWAWADRREGRLGEAWVAGVFD